MLSQEEFIKIIELLGFKNNSIQGKWPSNYIVYTKKDILLYWSKIDVISIYFDGYTSTQLLNISELSTSQVIETIIPHCDVDDIRNYKLSLLV